MKYLKKQSLEKLQKNEGQYVRRKYVGGEKHEFIFSSKSATKNLIIPLEHTTVT